MTRRDETRSLPRCHTYYSALLINFVLSRPPAAMGYPWVRRRALLSRPHRCTQVTISAAVDVARIKNPLSDLFGPPWYQAICILGMDVVRQSVGWWWREEKEGASCSSEAKVGSEHGSTTKLPHSRVSPMAWNQCRQRAPVGVRLPAPATASKSCEAPRHSQTRWHRKQSWKLVSGAVSCRHAAGQQATGRRCRHIACKESNT